MKRLKQDLAIAYRDEDQYWRQKCREEWLRLGDRNSKFFHNCLKGKHLQNRVLMLLDDLDQEQFSEGSKGDIAVEFFRDLLRSSYPFNMESLLQGFIRRVTPE